MSWGRDSKQIVFRERRKGIRTEKGRGKEWEAKKTNVLLKLEPGDGEQT